MGNEDKDKPKVGIIKRSGRESLGRAKTGKASAASAGIMRRSTPKRRAQGSARSEEKDEPKMAPIPMITAEEEAMLHQLVSGSAPPEKKAPAVITAEEEAMLHQLVSASSSLGTKTPKDKDWIPEQKKDFAKRPQSKLFGSGGGWKRSTSSIAKSPQNEPKPIPRPRGRPKNPEPEPEPAPVARGLPTQDSDFDLEGFDDTSNPSLREEYVPHRESRDVLKDDSDWLAPDKSSGEREALFGELLSMEEIGEEEELSLSMDPAIGASDPDDYGMLEFDDEPLDLEAISLVEQGEKPPAATDGYDPYAIEPDLSEHSEPEGYDPYALEPDYSEISGIQESDELAISPGISLDDYDLDEDYALADEKEELDAYLPDDFSDDSALPFSDESQDGIPLAEEDDHQYPREYGDISHEATAAPDDFQGMGDYSDGDFDDDLEDFSEVPQHDEAYGEAEDLDGIVHDALDDVLGKRLVEFEEHLLSRLSRRQEAASVRMQAVQARANQTGPRLAILPDDWGMRSPRSRALARSTGQKRLDFFLDLMKRRNAHGFQLFVGAAPTLRVGEKVERLRFRAVREDDWERIIKPICPPGKWPQFETNGDVDFIYEGKPGRFHANLFKQRLGGGAVFRRISDVTMDFKVLGLPKHLEKLADLQGGLCIFSGPYGSGTSSTVAALVEIINHRYNHRVITIEDPINYVFTPDEAIIHQREIGVHSRNFAEAMRSVLRESPDVVVVGGMLDRETTRLAIEAARAGILVFAITHNRTTSSTLDQLLDYFPDNERPRIANHLGDSLRVVVCQQLLPRKTGGNTPATEIFINTFAASRLFSDFRSEDLDRLIDESDDLGMSRMDNSLAELVRQQEVSEEVAMARAIDPERLHRLIHGEPEPEPEPEVPEGEEETLSEEDGGEEQDGEEEESGEVAPDEEAHQR